RPCSPYRAIAELCRRRGGCSECRTRRSLNPPDTLAVIRYQRGDKRFLIFSKMLMKILRALAAPCFVYFSALFANHHSCIASLQYASHSGTRVHSRAPLAIFAQVLPP